MMRNFFFLFYYQSILFIFSCFLRSPHCMKKKKKKGKKVFWFCNCLQISLAVGSLLTLLQPHTAHTHTLQTAISFKGTVHQQLHKLEPTYFRWGQCAAAIVKISAFKRVCISSFQIHLVNFIYLEMFCGLRKHYRRRVEKIRRYRFGQNTSLNL